MDQPMRTDYVRTIYTLFSQFEQYVSRHKHGRPFTYGDKTLIVFFMLMQLHRIYHFKAQHRWLQLHPQACVECGFATVPHRTTLSRRYKALYATIQDFVAFVGQATSDLDPSLRSAHLVEDKSLFKAAGPVWHQRDRAAARIPDKLRHLDPDATWAKSGYQGWVYGYGIHVTCNDAAFPKLVCVETGSSAEGAVLDQKAAMILEHLRPQTLAADDRYTKATRMRTWAKRGVALLTPALRWHTGRYAQAYHQFIKEPENAWCLRLRRTTIEPLFDLLAKVLGTTGQHKQLAVQRLGNVRTCLALATLTVQLAMIINSMWGLPLRNISTMMAACT